MVQQKNVKRSTMKSKHTQDARRNETKTFIYSPLFWIWQFYSEQKSWDIALLCCVIIHQNSRKLSELFPGQWQFLIPDNDILWSGKHRGPLKQPACSQDPIVPCDISPLWHMSRSVISYCPGPWHQMMVPGLPQISPLFIPSPTVTTSLGPASGQTGPSVKSAIPSQNHLLRLFMSNNFYLSLLSGILHLSLSGLMCLDWDILAKNLKSRQWA